MAPASAKASASANASAGQVGEARPAGELAKAVEKEFGSFNRKFFNNADRKTQC